MELSRYKACSELKLVEYFSSKAVSLAMRGYRSVSGREFDYSVFIRILIIDNLFAAADRNNALLCKLTFIVVYIQYRIYKLFRCYDLAVKSNIVLRGTDDTTVLVSISILGF